jgi:hypothetical protein
MIKFFQVSILAIVLTLLADTIAFGYYDSPLIPAFHFTAQKTLAVTTSSASTSLGSTGASSPVATTAIIQNLGANTAYINLGASSVVATTTGGYPVQPSQSVNLAIGSAGYIAAITAASTASVSVSTGY